MVLNRIFSSNSSIILVCFSLVMLNVWSVAGLIVHNQPHQNSIPEAKNPKQMSSEMRFAMALHGLLLWASLGFFMPVGILIIRMSSTKTTTRVRLVFYFHLILQQMLSVLLATVGAVMSIISFENSFNNNHQRIGLSLYVAIWLQTLLGFCRPHRGSRKRSVWYFLHWLVGTTIIIAGIINVYTGLEAYERKTGKSVRIWSILFTAEVSFLAFFYLFQDKWDYMQKQGVTICGDEPAVRPSGQPSSQSDKDLSTLPCPKANALRNLIRVT
ncbi:hypothetical protein Ancab_039644 [Ancistrocladus abbreviatus]